MATTAQPAQETPQASGPALAVRAACVLAVGLCTYVAGVHFTRTVTPG